jgi:L-fuculose-phosphate aldolase
VRVGPECVLMTPSGVRKRFMRSGDMVLVSLDGKKLAGSHEPSSEIGMHLKIYKLRPDITAVVHAHPCISTGFASAGIGLIEPVCSELVLTLGKVPLAPYALPDSDEVSIPRQSRGLYGVSRSKRLERAANAARRLWPPHGGRSAP